MRLSVADISKIPGESIAFEFSQDWPDFTDTDPETRFAGPIHVSGRASNVGDGVIEVNAVAEAKLLSQCVRCLKPVETEVVADICERFVRDGVVQPEEAEAYPFSNDTLELDTMVRDNLLLNLPMRVLCREDCLGLCPVCGCDLNTNTHCSCRQEAVDEHPMAALKALLNDDEEV